MDILFLVLTIMIAVSVYYDKKWGVVAGLIAMMILIHYPFVTKNNSKGIEISCKKECTTDSNNKLVCKTDCIKTLKEILK